MDSVKYKWLPVFDAERCSSCRGCAPACHCGAITFNEDEINFDPEICGSQGRCVEACPVGGIHMEWVPFFGNSSRGLVKAMV